MNYRCDICGCYLDPGEGRICEECRQESERRRDNARRVEQSVVEAENGQYELAV